MTFRNMLGHDMRYFCILNQKKEYGQQFVVPGLPKCSVWIGWLGYLEFFLFSASTEGSCYRSAGITLNSLLRQRSKCLLSLQITYVTSILSSGKKKKKKKRKGQRLTVLPGNFLDLLSHNGR